MIRTAPSDKEVRNTQIPFRKFPGIASVADGAGAAKRGATLALAVTDGRIAFEANLDAARSARLQLSSRLLRLAAEVHP